MKKTNSSLYFYLDEHLVTVHKKQIQHAIFSADTIPLAVRGSDNANNVKLLVTDEKGSIFFADGAKEKALTYTAYGHTPELPKQQSLLGFNREPFHALPELYLLGIGYHRGLSPQQMRFISPDTESPFGIGSFNAYAYCACDPINSIDPSGHSLIKWLGNRFGRREKIQAKITARNKSVNDYNNAIEEIRFPSTKTIKKETSLITLRRMDEDLQSRTENLPRITAISKNTANYRKKHGPIIKVNRQAKNTLESTRKAIAKRIHRIEENNAVRDTNNIDPLGRTGITIGVSNKQIRQREDWQ